MRNKKLKNTIYFDLEIVDGVDNVILEQRASVRIWSEGRYKTHSVTISKKILDEVINHLKKINNTK